MFTLRSHLELLRSWWPELFLLLVSTLSGILLHYVPIYMRDPLSGDASIGHEFEVAEMVPGWTLPVRCGHY